MEILGIDIRVQASYFYNILRERVNNKRECKHKTIKISFK